MDAQYSNVYSVRIHDLCLPQKVVLRNVTCLDHASKKQFVDVYRSRMRHVEDQGQSQSIWTLVEVGSVWKRTEQGLNSYLMLRNDRLQPLRTALTCDAGEDSFIKFVGVEEVVSHLPKGGRKI